MSMELTADKKLSCILSPLSSMVSTLRLIYMYNKTSGCGCLMLRESS